MTTDLQALLDQIDRLDQEATKGPWEEPWKQIPGYDGYEVSDFGNVRSYYLKGNHKKKRAKYPRLIKPDSSSGYPSFYIKSDSGKYLRVTAHILVMRAFVGPCPEGKEVAHLNGDSTDPRLVNLKYVTPKENNFHKVAHGTSGHGSKNSRAKLQGWRVEEIKYLAEKSVPQRKIADLFDIKTAQVNDILNERTWAETEARTALPQLAKALHAVIESCEETIRSVDKNLLPDERDHANRDHADMILDQLRGSK